MTTSTDALHDDRLTGLMQAAQAGDGPAYIELLTEITPRLRRIIRSRRQFLRNEDVEDLVQDVLLSLHSVRATYDTRRPFMPWLLAIARNRLADSARRYARREAHEIQVEEWDAAFAPRQAGIAPREYGDVDALKRAIQDLPAGQKNAIEMLKLRELSLKEASAACGISIGSLKVATHRAIRALRNTLTAVEKTPLDKIIDRERPWAASQ